jgi:catechol 2,3-dioxygenase-like lactoylglutathione lyase family enzyme
MVRITDPERSRSFYEALGFTFAGDFDIVRDAQLEATNYFFSPAGSNPSAANPSATQPMPAKRSTMPTAGVAAVAFVPYSALSPVFADRVTAAHRCSTLAAEQVQVPDPP